MQSMVCHVLRNNPDNILWLGDNNISKKPVLKMWVFKSLVFTRKIGSVANKKKNHPKPQGSHNEIYIYIQKRHQFNSINVCL